MSPRILSAAAKAAITAQETPEVFLILCTIQHADMETLYFARNTQDVISRGNTYWGWPFEIALPDETDDALPTPQLRIDNVDRRIMQGVRLLTTAPSVLLEVVLASTPDVVEAGPFPFTLRGVEYDALVITATLAPEDVLNEPAMQYRFTPQTTPGLFP